MDTINIINPITLSKYVIQYLVPRGYEVSHLKLQKLVYYIDAWHLVYYDQPLIKEDFEAWVHGPVLRDVWNHYKDKSILNTTLNIEEHIDISDYIYPEQIELINDVLDEYGDKTAYYLECLTHHEEPWRKARMDCAPSDRCDVVINKKTMKEYYGNLLNE